MLQSIDINIGRHLVTLEFMSDNEILVRSPESGLDCVVYPV
jgi:hypothetical protein